MTVETQFLCWVAYKKRHQLQYGFSDFVGGKLLRFSMFYLQDKIFVINILLVFKSYGCVWVIQDFNKSFIELVKKSLNCIIAAVISVLG